MKGRKEIPQSVSVSNKCLRLKEKMATLGG